MADDISKQSQEKIDKFNEELGKISDRIVDLGGLLGTNLVGNLQNAVNSARNMSDPLQDAASITRKLNELADKNETLIIQRKVAEESYAEALRSGNQLEIDRKEVILKQISAQLKIQQGIEDQLRSLAQVAEEEKKITEENKKQNSLINILKDKFADQYKTLKNMFTLGSIVDMLFKGSENIANFRKELGISYGQAYALNTELSFVGANVSDAYINGEKLKKSFNDLAKEMGFVANYGAESLVTMTNLTGRLGMSNKEAAQLTTLSRFQSKDTEKVLDNVGKTVTSMNKQKGSSILLKDVMKDIANVSMATAVSLGKNPEAIAKAVMAAKQLGTTLEQMEKTADSLLNFESSIESELKAELLTGKQMNLERARAAALSNDMKTLSEEIGKNQEVINSFAKGNRLEQQAIAESLGMSREDLAKMIYQQEAMKIGAEGVRAKYGEQAYEQLKAQNAQEKFTNAVEKLKTAFSGIVQIFSPILDGIAFLAEGVSIFLSKWFILYPLIAGVALMYLPAMVAGFKNIGSSIAGMAKNFTKLFSKEGRASLFGGGGGAEDAAKKAADTGEKAGAGGAKAGQGIKDTLKGISAGIQSFSKVSPADIGKLALSALALILLTPAIPALLLLQLVNGKLIKGALTGLGEGLAAMGKAMSGAAAQILIGEALLAGLGFALKTFTPIVKAFGEVITAVFGGLATVIKAGADGIATIFNSLQNVDISKLLAIGPALIMVGAGLTALGAGGVIAAIGSFLTGDPIKRIERLAAAGDGLQKASTGLQGIATGLSQVAAALTAIDTSKLEALGSFSTKMSIGSAVKGITDFITAPIKAIGGAIGGGETPDNAPMIAAINEVRDAVNKLYAKNTDIYIDSVKVTSASQKAGNYKLA